MSTIHFIGGEKGGVGKSVVARLLAQYFIDRSLAFVGVDADASHGSLIRYYAAFARPVDLSVAASTDEIMGLALESADRRVLVDLPAQSARMLSAWIGEAGVLDVARESDVGLVFWHVMDDGKDSLIALERLLERHGAAVRYVVVKNHGRGKDFSLLDASPAKARAAELGAVVVDLPELQETAMRKIDRLDASYWAAVNNAEIGAAVLSRMDRQRIKVWLQTSFDQLSRVAGL